ncbi:C-type lectin domain-containing protein [Hyalangium rubrum]|uniref:C-type lectin domain-containing protein n=1 Tax=Hyalangium rubrum TaxID=3103134 RepID=A0ABU5HH52_9BACT|nr:C-type lectin domain-containing protein [Hyalangium sp. s54d21]MDY7232787.1 C-type lectin domain-containing protein [Hyalangium sp. s54d21]
MSQQRTRAARRAWMKLGVSWALGAAMSLGCGGEAWEAEGISPSGEPTLGTLSQGLEYGGHEYVFVLTPKTWPEADMACLSMGKKLVTLESSAEADWLLLQQPSAGAVWLGLNDRVIEGAWDWTDGSSTYTRWAVGEPNNANNEDCAAFSPGTGLWNDLPCTKAQPFVCESFDPHQEKGYNGHSYIFFEGRKTWLEAQYTCSAQGMAPVTLNDADEEQWVKQQLPATRSWWLGYTDSAKEGTWVWSAPSSGYLNWRPGEPNNSVGNEDCAVANAGPNGSAPAGKWNDIPCSEYVQVICESFSTGPVFYEYVNFSTTDTQTATRYTTDVTVTLQPGQVLDVGTCGVPGAFASNDTYLRLLGPDGLEVMENDDACKGSGSRIRYRVPDCGGGTYVIRAGCYDAGSCGGRLGYNIGYTY